MQQMDIFKINDPSPEVSRAAAKSMSQSIGSIAARLLNFIKSRGDFGATCYEAEKHLGYCHQTLSARFTELKRCEPAKIKPTKNKRRTGSKRDAVVYVAA